MSNFDDERYSVCIVHADHHGDRAYYKYFRVADYIPEENPDELAPAIVREHTTSAEEADANPDYLYNPSAAYNHKSRESDFYLFRWKRDPYDWERQLTRSFYDDASLLAFKEAREVIFLNGEKGELGLRNALSEGIPFEGKTTGVFYIVYENENINGLFPAIRCERRDFSFADGRIRLRCTISNTRETVLSAPRVWLNGYDVIESPHALTSYRKLYAKLEEPESDGSVLLRSLDYYASDYVKWFIREESIQVSKSDRRVISSIIDAAFARPDALKIYLEAGAPEEEITGLRRAIAHIITDKEDRDRELFRRALLEDEGFYRECVEQVMKSSESILEERRGELAAVKSDIDHAQTFLTGLHSDIDVLCQKKQSLLNDIESLSSDLGRIRNEQEEVLGEIQSNIALKLGLKAAANQFSAASSPGLMIEESRVLDLAESNSSFKGVLLNNLKRFGVASVVDGSAGEREMLAVGLIGALSATRFIAAPQSIARQVADAVSVAIFGRSAKRVVVPPDYRDIASAVNAASGSDEVVIVEGVIDAVNEGVLFSLLSEDSGPVIVLSFVSHASASLVAKEAWGKIFLLNAESLLTYPRLSEDAKLQCAASGLESSEVSIDDAIEQARDLGKELKQLNLATGPLLLAATVFCAIGDFLSDDSNERYIAQHLFMCSCCDERSLATVNEWSGGDPGLLELAKKLGIHEL